MAASFNFTVRTGKLTWRDPHCFTRGDKSVEFRLLGGDVLIELVERERLGTTTGLVPTPESVERAIDIIADHFRKPPFRRIQY